MSQAVNEPARVTTNTASTINLVLLLNHNSLRASEVLPPLGRSDHNSVLTSATVYVQAPASKEMYLNLQVN